MCAVEMPGAGFMKAFSGFRVHSLAGSWVQDLGLSLVPKSQKPTMA